MSRDIAIAHKDYDCRGGGEVLAEKLAVTFDAPLFTGFTDQDNLGDADDLDVRGLWDDGTAGKIMRRGGMLRHLFYQFAWEKAEPLYDYDVVIQSGNEPLWYVPRDDQTTIAYTHSTPRGQYDLHHEFKARNTAENYRELAGEVFNQLYDRAVRTMYFPNTAYPDLFVANSELIKRRIVRYWRVDPDRIRVVYPPVATDNYGKKHVRDDLVEDEYYLSLNRLSSWKRIDEIVDAFRGLDAQLVIAGKGPEEEVLRERAADLENVTFVGFLSEQEKREYLASARALVYNPLNEDFGMVPVEALASGTPVVSVADGYQRIQIDDGQTGILYDRDYSDRETTVRNLRDAVETFKREGVSATERDLMLEASRYSEERFQREMRDVVDEAVRRSEITPKKSRKSKPLGEASPEDGQDRLEERAIRDGGKR